MTPVTITRHACGPRCYVFGLRVHHGTAGLASLALGIALKRPLPALVGALALAHDAQDFPFRDCDNHEPKGAR